MQPDLNTLRARALAYARQSPDDEGRREVQGWLDGGDDATLRAAFHPPLAFGTAGVRAPLGHGDSRMNRLIVRRLAAALCDYLLELDAGHASMGLCVGFDGRHRSETFAGDVCDVARQRGFAVRAFDRPVPTPLLAHSTQRHDSAAGVMITASHNPPGDNGVKVFWRGGQPILPPHDARIAERMATAATPPVADLPPTSRLGNADLDAYLDALASILPPPPPAATAPSVTYSAMCGVGTPSTRQLLARLGVDAVQEVPGQCIPHPDFPGLPSPNPEHPDALTESLALAARTGSDLVLVHDPDADRLAVAVASPAGPVRLTGDEVGCLLADFLLACRPAHAAGAVVTSLVSSTLLAAIAEARGAQARRVPTGVKWISLEGRALEEAGLGPYVFGYEEALGYCLPQLGDDKDGLAALALLVRCWQHHRHHGQGLLDARAALFRAHGIHRTAQRTWRWADPESRVRVLRTLADRPPESLGDASGPQLERDPRSPELCVLRYGPALRVALRPSGTEPKLKAYLERVEPAPEGAGMADAIEAVDARLGEAADALDAYVRGLASTSTV